jgi:PD-(D/E)XK nuclease superfamily
MVVVVTQPDREAFRRCRRQWDLQSRMRRDLEPVTGSQAPDLAAALHAALAVYYFPGMWDWDRAITIPLVRQGFDRELARQRERGAFASPPAAWPEAAAAGHELLSRYLGWAPGVDAFAPVLIDADFDVQVIDPARTGAGLTGPDGQPVRFRGRIDMLAVDQHDAYWLVQHRFGPGDWPAAGQLAGREQALADAWAWEQFYPGLAIAGTIHNELRPDGADTAPANQPRPGGDRAARKIGRQFRRQIFRLEHPPGADSAATDGTRPLVRQHEPSGGGRSIPQHRRLYAAAREPAAASEIEHVTTGAFRRTWVRHSPAAIAAAGQRLAADTAAMLAAAAAPPNPSDANCRPCAFLPPCLAMRAGRDGEVLLRSGYQSRPPDVLTEGRLGGGAWGLGRGAAPLRPG